MNFPRTLVIGIDGATFDVIKPWAEAGLLPTFAHLMKHGAHATLDAFPSMNSAAAWTNIVTGYNPGQHSIFSFTKEATATEPWHPTSARDRYKPAFWHLLAASGQRVGVMNVPITFPAENINGFMVSGMDTPHTGLDGFTEPKGLYQELRRANIEYVIDVTNMGQAARSGETDVPASVREMTLARTRSFLYLVQKYPCDAAMLVYIGGDRMSHYFWQETLPVPDAPEWKPLRELFQLYDAQLQEILQHAGSETTVFLLSDHGFGPVRRQHRALNGLFQLLGYQALRKQSLQTKFLGTLLQTGRRVIPSRWQRGLAMRFPRTHSKATGEEGYGSLDLLHTRAYATIGGLVHFNSHARSPHGIVIAEEYDSLWQELAEVMHALTDPDSGAPLVATLQHQQEFYRGPYAYLAADMFTRWQHANLRDALAYRRNGHDIIIGPPHPKKEWVGTHRAEGIFIAYGKGIRPGVAHAPISHFEVAPTILYLHDQPIAEDMDGHVLTDWFDDAMLSSHTLTSKTASEYIPHASDLNAAENELIESRLRQLGYIE
jgi:predicted AlkP superfamily phosphohydrolase/phosphomutase